MMDGMIETYVAQLGSVVPQRADLYAPAAIIQSLGGQQMQTSDDHWTLQFENGPFASAIAEIEDKQGVRSLRITFEPRVPHSPLTALTADPAAWESGPRLPDTGRLVISRHWFDLPSNLVVSCSIILAGDQLSAAGDVVCFVGRL